MTIVSLRTKYGELKRYNYLQAREYTFEMLNRKARLESEIALHDTKSSVIRQFKEELRIDTVASCKLFRTKSARGMSETNIVTSADISEYDERNIKEFMLSYLPRFVSKALEVYLTDTAIEIKNLNGRSDESMNQYFIDKATYTLPMWEKDYGIQSNSKLNLRQRREQVKAKMRGTGACTKDVIKNMAEAFSNGECEIIEHPSQYKFTVKFKGTRGVPDNLKAFIDILEGIKPAHLAYDLEFTYNSHESLSPYTHEYLSRYSNKELRESKLS